MADEDPLLVRSRASSPDLADRCTASAPRYCFTRPVCCSSSASCADLVPLCCLRFCQHFAVITLCLTLLSVCFRPACPPLQPWSSFSMSHPASFLPVERCRPCMYRCVCRGGRKFAARQQPLCIAKPSRCCSHTSGRSHRAAAGPAGGLPAQLPRGGNYRRRRNSCG